MQMLRWLVLVGMLASTDEATAAERASAVPGVKELLACRALPAAAERLACYDRGAATLGGEVDRGQVVVVDKAEVRAAQRARFGLPAPGLELFAGKDGAPLQTVKTSIAGAVTDPFGKLLVTLADGSRWHQIDDYSLARTPRAGQPVVIFRAAVGSFKMAIAGQGAIRVRRER